MHCTPELDTVSPQPRPPLLSSLLFPLSLRLFLGGSDIVHIVRCGDAANLTCFPRLPDRPLDIAMSLSPLVVVSAGRELDRLRLRGWCWVPVKRGPSLVVTCWEVPVERCPPWPLSLREVSAKRSPLPLSLGGARKTPSHAAGSVAILWTSSPVTLSLGVPVERCCPPLVIVCMFSPVTLSLVGARVRKTLYPAVGFLTIV